MGTVVLAFSALKGGCPLKGVTVQGGVAATLSPVALYGVHLGVGPGSSFGDVLPICGPEGRNDPCNRPNFPDSSLDFHQVLGKLRFRCPFDLGTLECPADLPGVLG